MNCNKNNCAKVQNFYYLLVKEASAVLYSNKNNCAKVQNFLFE